MRRRKPLPVLAGLAVLALGVFVLWSQAKSILREKCDQIHGEMTMGEAEAILGLPGDYSTKYYRDGIACDLDYHRTFDPSGLADLKSDKPGTTTHHWKSETTIVEVHYGGSGRVVAVDCYSYVGRQEGPFGNLLWRIKRQWRKWFPE